MKEKMKDHNQKIEAAKQVLQNALARIPGDVNIGLRVFGQGNGWTGCFYAMIVTNGITSALRTRQSPGNY